MSENKVSKAVMFEKETDCVPIRPTSFSDKKNMKKKWPPLLSSSSKKDSRKREERKASSTLTLAPESCVPEDCLRFVCISDTHSRVESERSDFISRIPDGDVLLHAGDFTLHGEIEEFVKFNEFLGKLPHPIKIVIPGNHEVSLDPRGLPHNISAYRKYFGLRMCLDQPSVSNYKDVVDKLIGLLPNAILLTDSFVSLFGVKIYGLPWVPAYGAPGFGLHGREEMQAKVDLIPTDTDILLSHGPAQDYGVYHDEITTYINAAICNRRYKPSRDPIVFNYQMPPTFSRKDFLKRGLRSQDLTVTCCS